MTRRSVFRGVGESDRWVGQALDAKLKAQRMVPGLVGNASRTETIADKKLNE
jgi:hypothetical protein